MVFQPLASSSAGNCYLVYDGSTRLMIECGITRGAIRKRSGLPLSAIDACLVSHEHKDHSRSAAELLKDGMRVFMSYGTAQAIGLEGGLLELAEQLEHNVPVLIGTMDVVPFTTYHDAAEPLGFLVRSRVDGEVLVFATDTVNLGYRFPGVTIMAIEANYDDWYLSMSRKLPKKTIERIKNTHMSIDTTVSVLKKMDVSRLREVHVLHLSDSNSNAAEFLHAIKRALPASVSVQIADK